MSLCMSLKKLSHRWKDEPGEPPGDPVLPRRLGRGCLARWPVTAAAPANDLCTAAVELMSGVNVSGTTGNATSDAVAVGNCSANPYSAPGVWYYITVPPRLASGDTRAWGNAVDGAPVAGVCLVGSGWGIADGRRTLLDRCPHSAGAPFRGLSSLALPGMAQLNVSTCGNARAAAGRGARRHLPEGLGWLSVAPSVRWEARQGGRGGALAPAFHAEKSLLNPNAHDIVSHAVSFAGILHNFYCSATIVNFIASGFKSLGCNPLPVRPLRQCTAVEVHVGLS